ncbi:biotin-protein ligase [Gongronella butleri]|nr:biotin-protein ligase [Gongronella butleri]
MNGDINQRIRNYVYGGGRYAGFCAGAYYASASIAFEVGTALEVKGSRELGFYPGASHGCMYPGFVYDSQKGARAVAVELVADKHPLAMYYNGGGYFVAPERYDQVKVLAKYPSTDKAAIVQCKVGYGSALLSAVHPEYDVQTTPDIHQANDHEALVATLTASRHACLAFLAAQFRGMGLKVDSKADNEAPELTPMYLGAHSKPLADTITRQLRALAKDDVIKDASNHFYLSDWNDASSILQQKWKEQLALADVTATGTANTTKLNDSQPPISLMIQHAPPNVATEPIVPPKTLTPLFDMAAYFKQLAYYRDKEFAGAKWYQFGNAMLYTRVITSTQTVLDKNYAFAQALPPGLVCLASHQVAGRGRGRNSWVSQTGALQFSLEFRHSLQLQHAPVVFIQYIAALAMVESVRSRPGYENVPLRLKWPNDVYADLPHQGLKKVGGLLVNSSFAGSEFLLVVGCGMNLSNQHPTVSVNEVIAQHDPKLPPLTSEDVLANLLVLFERYYHDFCEKGMGPWFLDQYYKRWLHSDKLVTLTTHDNVRAKIVGITSDYGMLEAVNADDNRTRYTLQPDGNSFDMLKGLIIKKT